LRAYRPGGQRVAAASIRDVLHGLGLAVEEQPCPCTGGDRRGAGPSSRDEPRPVEAKVFSPARKVTTAAVPAPTLNELAAADLRGKIARLHGDSR